MALQVHSKSLFFPKDLPAAPRMRLGHLPLPCVVSRGEGCYQQRDKAGGGLMRSLQFNVTAVISFVLLH